MSFSIIRRDELARELRQQNPCAATRRAIVQAAAKVGERMEVEK